jgi:putative transposase
MTNHVHLLLTPGSAKSLPLLMQSMGRSYVQRLNERYGRTGTLWEGRYRASLVQQDHYLLACYRYIELNPVRAGLVDRPRDYPYSSHARNAFGQFDALVTPHASYLGLHRNERKRLTAYRALFDDALSDETLRLLRDTTNACLVIGDGRFKDQIEKMLGRSVRQGRRGRPPKESARKTVRKKTRFDPN